MHCMHHQITITLSEITHYIIEQQNTELLCILCQYFHSTCAVSILGLHLDLLSILTFSEYYKLLWLPDSEMYKMKMSFNILP